MINKEDIHKAYRFLREKNCDIPDDVLDFMKDSSLAALNELEENKLTYVKGNLIDMAFAGEFDIIAHGCNCFNTWGAGIAKEMKVKCPDAYKQDMETKKGDKSKLGSFTVGVIDGNCPESGFLVCNFYTQYDYGRGLKFNYDKFRRCLIDFRMRLSTVNFRIGMPKIGAGHAGGDWNKIEQIIIDELGDLDVTIVEWDGRS